MSTFLADSLGAHVQRMCSVPEQHSHVHGSWQCNVVCNLHSLYMPLVPCPVIWSLVVVQGRLAECLPYLLYNGDSVVLSNTRNLSSSWDSPLGCAWVWLQENSIFCLLLFLISNKLFLNFFIAPLLTWTLINGFGKWSGPHILSYSACCPRLQGMAQWWHRNALGNRKQKTL